MTYLKENFEELLSEYNGEKQSFEEGSIISGVIVSIDDKVVGVDIGSKSIGYISVNEFSGDEIKINDVIDVLLNKIENKKFNLLISYESAKKVKTWNNLKKYITDGTIIEGKIIGKVKGGFAIDLNGIVAFLPKSQIDSSDLANVNGLIGQKDKFAVLKVDDERGNVVVSKRAIMDGERAKERDKILANIKLGDTLEGVIKNLTDYGAFVDFGSFDGLLHLTDISWSRVRHPSDVLKLGQQVKCQVIKYDPDTKKVSLGLKQLQENPWVTISNKYPKGSIIKGKISTIAQYGVFVEIENGIEGLVHISEISWFKNSSPTKILSTGQEVNVMVLDIDTEHHRISLGIKQTTANPWKEFADKHEVGDLIEGTVKNIEDYGAFVELPNGIDALLHISDLEHEGQLNTLNKGDKIQVILLGINYEEERVSVGLKQIKNNLKEVIKKYEKGVEASIIVTGVRRDYLEVEVKGSQLKAIVRRVDVAKDKKDQKTEKFKVGDMIDDATIVSFDAKSGKFFVSLKPLSAIEENEDDSNFDMTQYTENSVKKNTLGSVFGNLFDNYK